MEKNIALLVIPEESLLDYLRVTPAISDLRLERCTYDFERRALVLMLSSSEFVGVRPGEQAPILNWTRILSQEINILTR